MTQGSVLVTGATGFIGSHIVRLLLESGVDRVVATNFSGCAGRLHDVLDKVELAQADVSNFSSVLRLIAACRPKTIYHLGALSPSTCDAHPEGGIQANAVGTFHVLEAARLFGVQQVVFAGSIRIFSPADPSDPVLNDYSLTRPDTVYSTAKLFSENIGLVYRRQYGLDYRGLRLPGVVGPGETAHGVLAYFGNIIEEALKEIPCAISVAPYTRIPVMHVKDAARAFIELAQAPAAQIRTVSYIVLGPTPSPTAQELVDAVKIRVPNAKIVFKVHKRIQEIIDAVFARRFDDRYARIEWGWKHQYELAGIVDDSLAELKQRPSSINNPSPAHS